LSEKEDGVKMITGKKQKKQNKTGRKSEAK